MSVSGVLLWAVVAFALSITVTPIVRGAGKRFGIVDIPGGRKIHHQPIPRTGGVGVFFCTLSVLGISLFFLEQRPQSILLSEQYCYFYFGAAVTFFLGFVDDVFNLNAWLKLLLQVLAVSVAFYGGVRIPVVPVLDIPIDNWVLSYALTVCWMVLVINAVNLADGVDGLAAGIVFFVCVLMVSHGLYARTYNGYAQALVFAILGGSTLGFLRYNFNPASIFMGDGGSYFLGYVIGGLSVISSAKTQVGSALLIPIVAMGVPFFDTVLAPIRRFVRGKSIFSPDKGHIHHKLLARGYNSRQVVLFLYTVTVLLCLTLILLEATKRWSVGISLLAIALVLTLLIKKIGYLEYLVVDKIFGWIYDMLDTTGLTSSRRTFLNYQLEIARSTNVDDLWGNMQDAFNLLDLDYAELTICTKAVIMNECTLSDDVSHDYSYRYTPVDGENEQATLCRHCLFKVELPLVNEQCRYLGTLWVVKDVSKRPLPRLSLRRMEQLRCSTIDALQKILLQ